MSFSFDTPISNFDEDLLHRSEFAKQFAKNLIMLPNNQSFTISLNGCWGSGKTSLINLVKKEIEHLCNYDEEITSWPIVVDFAPWNTLDENAIISQFFSTFSQNFPINKLKSFLKNSKTQLAINIVKQIPRIGTFISKLQDSFDKYLKDFLGESQNLITQKNEIEIRLGKTSLKYIVFIDDIDRLNNKEIRLLIQLIKAVCDFPNVIYVLSFDKNIVAKALENEQNIDGRSYLEKIIQLSIDIPAVGQTDLHQYLFKKIDETLGSLPENEFDSERWSGIFHAGFGDYFTTLRQVNRYTNSLKFKYSSYKAVLDTVDFLIMESIAMFEPELLDLIRENRELLCNLTLFGDKEKLKEEFINKVNTISKNYEILPYLFPILQKSSFGTYYPIINVHEQKSKGRICFEDHFDFYFAGHLTNNSISRENVLTIISTSDETTIANYFKTFNNKKYNTFLQYLYGFSYNNIYLDVLKEFMPKLLPIHGNFKDLTRFLGSSNFVWLYGVIEKICLSLTDKEINSYLQKILNTSTNYECLIDVIYHLARGTDFYFPKNENATSFISEKDIQQLHTMLVSRICKAIYSEDVYTTSAISRIIRFLQHKNETELKAWFEYIAQKNQLLTLMDNLVNVGYGESNIRFRTYTFMHSLFDEYVNLKQVETDVNTFLEQNKNQSIPSKTMLSKILFLMPLRKDDPYTLTEIFAYCKQHNLTFNYKDEFIDE